VDTKGSGNVMYLPLDKLTERRTQTLTLDEQRQSPAARAPAEPPADDTVDVRRERGTR